MAAWFPTEREAPPMTTRLAALSALAALCCAGTVLAAGPEAAPEDKARSRDSQVVCQVQKVTGSRLDTERVCLTRAQWREQRRQNRQDLERAQRIRQGPDRT